MSTMNRPSLSFLLCFCGILMATTGYVLASQSSQYSFPIQQTPANFWELSGPQAVEPMPYELINADPASVQMRFFDPQVQYNTVQFDGQTFTSVRMPSEGSTVMQGEPDLPRVTRLVMINPTGNVALNVTSSSFTTISNVDAAPKQPYEGEELANRLDNLAYAYNDEIYAQDAWYPEQIASITTPATLRDVRFVTLAVAPVQYNPSRRELRVYDNIEVSIENTGGIGENEIVVAPEYISPSFKLLYSRFENFAGSSLDELPVLPGKYLIVCNNDAAVQTEAQRLVDWHRRKGLDASFVTTTTTGGTAVNIRDYISNLYTSSNGKLEFVCLFGDPDGGIAVPSGNSSPQGYDNFFGVVNPSGGPSPDPVPDIAVGRLPATNSTELQEIVTKSINYESNPYTGDMNWFNRAHCSAHTNFIQSNPSTKEYTRQIMLQRGVTVGEVQVFPDGISETQTNAILDDLISVFNQRMSWVGEMATTALASAPAVGGSGTVGGALPFVYSLTCGTGSFDDGGQTLSEAWVNQEDQSTTSPRGAIGCVGLYGLGTHVPFNNIVDAGAMYGIYALGIREMGVINIAAKLELYKNYQSFDPGSVTNFCYWANLMGDPGVKIWANSVNATTVMHPATISRGTNNLTITVTNPLAQNVEGAQVCLLKGTETFARGYTNSNGQVNLPIATPTTGSLLVTVTKNNQLPYLGTITVNTVAANLGYSSHSIDDDNAGGTVGNNDDILSPGETIDISIVLTNTGSATVSGINATLTSSSPGVSVINGVTTYPNITAGGTGSPASLYRIGVTSVFNAEPVSLYLNLVTAQGNFTVRLDLTPSAADVAYTTFVFGGPGGNLNPNESGTFTPTITNTGQRTLLGADGILRSLDPRVSITDSIGVFGNIGASATGNSVANTFSISISNAMFNGHVTPMQLVVYDDNGFRDSTNFNLTIGTFTSTSPSGPDAYGYYAYDNTENQPAGCASTYSWIEIAPFFGGPGTLLNMSDLAEDDDDTQVRELPFDFTMYGQTFDSITICSNGWIAFGSYPTIDDFRNYRMGSPIGAPNMVAAYWDDLYLQGADSNVYVHYNAAEHMYIVEWRARTQYSDVTEIFQIVIYDPAFYPSATGDGKVKVQYHTVNLSPNTNSNDNDYATVGIQNEDHSIGLDYYYWNSYGAGAASLIAGRSILYTTDPTGQLNASVTVNSPNGGESIYLGQGYNVLWQTTAISGNINIQLNRNYPVGAWEDVVLNTSNDGVYVWATSGAATANARIRVISVLQPQYGDTSDANFTLAVPLATITSPNGGESMTPGEFFPIVWTSTGLGSASVELNRTYPSGVWEQLSPSSANGYDWTVTGPSTTTARIRIRGVANPLAGDTTDANFTIGQAPVISHKQKSDQASGAATFVAILNDDNPASNVFKLYYRLVGGVNYDSVAFALTGNPFEWAATIPALLDGNYEYYIRTVDTEGLADRVPDTGTLKFNVGDICVPWIAYDDGTAENYNWVNGPGYRWAVSFDPGTYPFSLCAAQFAINPTAPTEYKGPVRVTVQLADGPSGTPGTVVVVDTTGSINAIGGLPGGAAWTNVVFGNIPVSGPFYVVVENTEPRDCPVAFGLDTSSPNGNSYFYDFCDLAWYPESAGTENSRPGDRMIRVSGFNLEAPVITIKSSGNDIILNWASTGAPYYKVYSSTNPNGPFSTLVGSTSSTSYTHVGIVTTVPNNFYIVVSSQAP